MAGQQVQDGGTMTTLLYNYMETKLQVLWTTSMNKMLEMGADLTVLSS